MKDIFNQSSGLAASREASSPARKQWMRIPAAAWKALLLLFVLCIEMPLFAQNITVSGNVHDAEGEPIIGASVIVVGASTGIATDFDGNFVLNNVASNGKLRVSYVGYNTEVIDIKGRQSIEVTMTEDSQVLDEVVVVGYGTMKKSDLTGSVSSIDTKKLNAKGATSVLANLQGTTPGVNITQSTGRSNGGMAIEIRGKSSINGSTTPIYVVDGIICGDIDFLNPQDIERVDVLKDASSTAIYGSRATAGVVMITTKGGLNVSKDNKASITYDGYYGFNKVARMPEFMDGQQFYSYRFAKFLEPLGGGSQPVYYIPGGAGAGVGQALLQVDNSDPTSDFLLKQMLADNATTDWPGLVVQDGHQQNHYVAVSGSSDTANYHFGLGYSDEEGVYKGDGKSMFNIKGSIDARVNKVISAGININGAYIKNKYAYDSAIAGAYRVNPFSIPYDENGGIIHYPANSATLGTNGNQFSDFVNPLENLRDYKSNRKTYRFMGNLYLQLDIIPGLFVKTTFSPSYTSYRNGAFDGYINPLTGTTYGGADPKTQNEETDGYNHAYVTNYSSFGWTWDNIINYNKTFNRIHSVTAMGLFSMERGKSENYYIAKKNVMDNTDWWNLGSGYTTSADSSSFGMSSLMSYALRLNYSLMDRYMLTATMRWDGSSKLADGYRWTSFPSAAVAWRISEESFLRKEWLNNLKLRLSYGVTGNNKGIGNYASIVGIGGPVYYPFGGSYTSGYYAGGIVDKLLTWEKSHEFNVGLDFGFLQNRINGSIDWYNKKSTDLLYKVELPLEAGGVSMSTNVGSVRNTGIEVALTTINIDTRDWNWTTSFTFAHNKNKVLEINGVADEIVASGATGSLFVGQPINNVYTYQEGGIVNADMMTVPDTDIAKEKGFTPGEQVRMCDYYYECYGITEGQPFAVDVNGDGKWDAENDRVLMNSEPKWTGSLTSNLSYRLPKNGGELDFSFTIYTKQGGKLYSPFYAADWYDYHDRGRGKMAMDYYIPMGTLVDCDGVNPDGTYINPVFQTSTHYGEFPTPNCGNNDGLGAGQTYWETSRCVTDASFVKVKNITLGYTFNKNILKYIGCKQARVYCTITNPFVWSKYKGFDPEWANAATKNDGPSVISYQIGASIKF